MKCIELFSYFLSKYYAYLCNFPHISNSNLLLFFFNNNNSSLNFHFNFQLKPQ